MVQQRPYTMPRNALVLVHTAPETEAPFKARPRYAGDASAHTIDDRSFKALKQAGKLATEVLLQKTLTIWNQNQPGTQVPAAQRMDEREQRAWIDMALGRSFGAVTVPVKRPLPADEEHASGYGDVLMKLAASATLPEMEGARRAGNAPDNKGAA